MIFLFEIGYQACHYGHYYNHNEDTKRNRQHRKIRYPAFQ
jgi:hypothetical protein